MGKAVRSVKPLKPLKPKTRKWLFLLNTVLILVPLTYLGYPFFGIVVFSYAALALMLISRENLLKLFARAEMRQGRRAGLQI